MSADTADHDCTKNYEDHVKFQANRFMSLLTYLSHDWEPEQRPQWLVHPLEAIQVLTQNHHRVRATYTTRKHRISPSFLESDQPVPQADDSPLIVHITAADFEPSLSTAELQCIDQQIVQSNRWAQPPQSLWASVKGDGPRPTRSCGLMAKPPGECAHCGKVVADGSVMRECPK